MGYDWEYETQSEHECAEGVYARWTENDQMASEIDCKIHRGGYDEVEIGIGIGIGTGTERGCSFDLAKMG